MCNMNKRELMSMINKYSFMVDDIALYLNTHPCCSSALSEYDKYKKLRKEAIDIYTKKFGPICKYDVDTCECWDYINQPWPWEGECNC